MAQLDAYLVEKLREILERLYSKDKIASSTSDELGLASKQSSGVDSLSQQQQYHQQVAYRRSPLVFPYAPDQTDMQTLTNSLSKKSELEASLSVNESVDDTEYFENGASVVGVNTENYYGIPRITNNETFFSPTNDSDHITYGVEMNYTSNTDTLMSGNLSESDNFNTEDESSALTRNLHEFIHILKMSLKSGSSAFSSNEENNFFLPNRYQNLHPSANVRNNMTATGTTDAFSGIVSASTTNMEFNFTQDDLLDLDNLLAGDDSTFGLPFKHILIIVTYLVIACVSIIGNLLVVQLVIRSRRFHTLTHALLANLAAADLFLATFNIPFSAARVIMAEWPFGNFLCRTVPFVQVTSVYATSFTMAVIGLDRYQVIMNPLGKRLKCSQGVLLVIAIWIVSAILSIPYALNHQVATILTVRVVKRCQADFGSPQARQILTVATFLAQYLLPLLFTTASYIAIMKRLWYRSSGLGSTTPRQVAAQSRAKRKTIKMLVLTVICFALSWAPINIYHLLTHFSIVRHNSTSILICHIIAMSSSMYNPFIFCGLNEHFRREAVKWLHCFRTRRSPIVHPGTEVNGLLTRADQACRRNISTVVNTTVSVQRSPQHHSMSVSPRACQRRQILATSGSPIRTPAAVYMTPRHNVAAPMERVVEMSPVQSRFVRKLDSSENGNGGSPSGYQPELLFLVNDTMSPINEDHMDPDEIDSGDDVMNGQDFLDSLCDEWNSNGVCKTLNHSVKDKDDTFSPSLASSRGEGEVDSEENGRQETAFMGQCETVT